jgi:hypothetical protein
MRLQSTFLIPLFVAICFHLLVHPGWSQESKKWLTGLVDGLDTMGFDSGDLLFAQSKTFDGIMTQIGTCSPFTHSAMILRDASGNLWLLHATDNDYDGNRMEVKNEPVARNGVILTRIEDLFNSINGGQSGFYHHIWIRKMKTGKLPRPSEDILLSLYQKYKNRPFEPSKWQFILTSTDLHFSGKDLFLVREDQAVICSELMVILFSELNIPFPLDQPAREITPRNIYGWSKQFFMDPVVFQFRNGKYQVQSD